MKWASLAWNGSAEPSMECLEVNMEPSLSEEQPEEVYSVQWNVASDMFWQFHDKGSALLGYLAEYGPREFPRFKKGLKKLKRKLKRLADSDSFPTTICWTNEKPINLKTFIAEVAGHVSVATVRLKQPGLRKFFTDGIGKHVLAALERKHSCSIEMVCEKEQVVSDNKAQSSVTSALTDLDEILDDMKQKVNSSGIVNQESSLVDLKDIILEGTLTELSSTEQVDRHSASTQLSPVESAIISDELSWKSMLQNKDLPTVEPVELESSECTWIQNTQIRVCVGDLTKEEVDAVLIMNKDNLELKKGGQLNKHIALTAGPSLQKECKLIITENGAQLPGNAVMTSAGNLPCKNLVHVIAYPGPPQILDLQLGVKAGLQLADERGLGSIALPTIGAGGMGLSLTNSARVLSGGILSFLERPPRNIREIKIVLYGESLMATFAQDVKNDFAPIKTLEEYSPLSTLVQDKDCIPGVVPRDNALNERSTLNPPTSTAEFRVYGKDKKSVTNVVNGLRGVYSRHCTVQRVTHKLVSRLIQSSWAWLLDVASKHDTDLKKGAHNGTIIVGGNSEDVALVVECIWQEISRLAENENEIEKRKLVAQYVRWHYIILDREIALSEKVSSMIEEACSQKHGGVTLFVNDHDYTVDFNTMTVVSCGSKYPPLRLIRKIMADTGVFTPDSWSPQPCFPDGIPVPVAMVPVTMFYETEYQSVADMFYRTGGYGNIISIERVQNLCLYKQYTTYKQEVEQTNSRSGRINRNELQLFHGTKGSNVSSINRQGFNRTFCGKTHGAVYGNGVYFASRASYSMNYTSPDSNGLRHMYLARVVVGFYALGRKGLLVPPPLSTQQPEVLFDSVVDNTVNPNVFVVFHDSQCYPEYLITFK
ncbi:hypothetical protein ACROYT_G031091 [Oculina patagonica]